MNVLVMVGTAKGLFVMRSADRQSWTMDEPLFKGWSVTSVAQHRGRWLVGTSSQVYGTAVHISEDLAQWRQVENGPAYAATDGRQLSGIWTIASHDQDCFAGVCDAGLFVSRDGGESWSPLEGLNEHYTRKSWCPGAGGLCAHAILIDPTNPRRLWCGISAVGVFRSDDGGDTWHAKNHGVPVIIEDQEFSEIGFCVHALAQDPTNPDRIYRQDHRGMFRTDDGGDAWESIENGLPSGFGFPLAIDPISRSLYAIPLESDEYRMPIDGRLRVYRSTDAGDHWEPSDRGLPGDKCYAAVLRGAMSVDGLDPGGVYFGTTSGDVFASCDGGQSWSPLPGRFPRINCVTAFTG